jgi:hypothetical protein
MTPRPTFHHASLHHSPLEIDTSGMTQADIQAARQAWAAAYRGDADRPTEEYEQDERAHVRGIAGMVNGLWISALCWAGFGGTCWLVGFVIGVLVGLGDR